MNRFKIYKTLLLLVMALTTGNAYARYYYRSIYKRDFEYMNMTFNLFGWVNSENYNFVWNDRTQTPVAFLTGISGSDEEVEVPFSVQYDGIIFEVNYLGEVSNSNVKKLTFKNYTYFSLTTYDLLGYNSQTSYGSLDCPALEELVFERGVALETQAGTPALQCPNLTDIYFKSSIPSSFSNPWSRYFTTPTLQVTAHVANRTAEQCESLHTQVPWAGFKEVVPYSELEENVNITVTVEEAYAGTGAMFQYDSDHYIYGYGTKTYTKKKHANYTFYVADDDKSKVKNVYVNGKDVLAKMTAVSSDESPFYSAKNPRKYTIVDMTSDVSILITTEETVDHYTLCVGHGGKIEFNNNTYENDRYCQFSFDKSDTLTVTATPYEGYEFDSFWYEGIKYDSDLGNWIKMETHDDGTFVVNLALGTFQLPYTDNSHVIAFNFREKAHKPTVHIQTIGTPRNTGLMYFVVGNNNLYSVGADDLATLNRTDALDAGSTYKLRFIGAKFFNLKHVIVNGEKVALTGNVAKETAELTLSDSGDNILLEFDDVNVVCTTTDNGYTHLQAYLDGQQQSFNRDYASEMNLPTVDTNRPIILWMQPNEGFNLQFFFNETEIQLADETIPEADIPGNYMFIEDGNYKFQITDAMSTAGSKMRLSVLYKKKSFFDVNNDGEINVSDVTSLVNKILHP